MSSRKSRLSLSSEVRKDAGGKSTCRTPVRSSKGTKHSDTRTNDDSCEVSPSQGAGYSSVIPLTQDNSFHAINGVSWKWNSPQRFHGQLRMKAANGRKSNQKPLLKQKHDEMQPEAPKEATGFNKFISKLNLLMGKENVGENVTGPEPVGFTVDNLVETDFHTAEHGQCEDQAHSEDSDDDIFQRHLNEDADSECGTLVDTAGKRPSESVEAFDNQFIYDELDDSKLDRILIEASQTAEQNLNNPTLPPPTVIPKRAEPDVSIPFEMNDSDMDGFLVQASLMVEEKLSDSSQESTSNKQGANVNHIGAVSSVPSHTKNPSTGEEGKLAQPNAHRPNEGAVAGTSEVTMSQANLKALLEKKRQEALLRLQNSRLKRAMKGTNPNR